MTKYEKRYYSETEYKLWQFITVWNKIKEDNHNYNLWLAEGNEPTIVPYEPPTPITFEQLKENKINEIKNSFEQAKVFFPCVTVQDRVVKGGNEFESNVRCSLTVWEAEEEPTTTKPWFDIEDNIFDITIAEMKQMQVDMIRIGENYFAKYVYLESEVKSITEDTPENRDLITNIKW